MKIFTTIALLVAAAISNTDAAGCDLSGTYNPTSAASIIKSCKAITVTNLNVPGGVTLDLTKLQAGTTVTFKGTTTFGVKNWEGPLIAVSGNKITLDGTGATLDGQGAKYWDGKGGNGGVDKPKFFKSSKLVDSTIKGFKLLNTPVHAFSINTVTNSKYLDITIDNKLGDSKGGHNTDAFDVGSSTGVLISGAIVYNQDDCLAINSGTGITFTNGFCSGGHGLSIGSVGGRSSNIVKDVTISNTKVVNSDNGVRIKTVSGAKGSVSGITYSNIQLENIGKYGIVIEQDYLNGGPTGKPTNGVPITNVTLNKITGSVSSKATNTYILCAQGACSNWKFTGVAVTGGKASTKCSYIPANSNAKC
ncbi:polygalacturonase [Saprolegnia diclina VS20]|uniref:endo-polygalacturonase n=1 Tax=Saprolegnia diclina (strain VS20) TaxID=1156394 RepID=T0Q8N1_SAPDV|nr:polygalacturonase [Saprolegnia diclina VS20]EQC34264.1 polygalacturonase [Saprolegnia diclina VS20]|eukprot:XP_008612126.1 polygalacturonase [Saprolegnia diclina VS20]